MFAVFPYKIKEELHIKPVFTYILIGINILVFLYTSNLNENELHFFFLKYGYVQADFKIYTLITHLFIHVNFMHLFGNMLYLYLFGRYAEEYLGKFIFVIIYLFAGLGAVFLTGLTAHGFATDIPLIGASGAISGIEGAFFVLFSGVSIDCVYWFIFKVGKISIPAVIFIGGWFLIQLYSGIQAVQNQQIGGVGFWAHVGGFFFTFIAILYYRYGGDITKAFKKHYETDIIDNSYNLFFEHKNKEALIELDKISEGIENEMKIETKMLKAMITENNSEQTLQYSKKLLDECMVIEDYDKVLYAFINIIKISKDFSLLSYKKLNKINNLLSSGKLYKLNLILLLYLVSHRECDNIDAKLYQISDILLNYYKKYNLSRDILNFILIFFPETHLKDSVNLSLQSINRILPEE